MMLGLTTPDAIAFGSLCAALVAAYAGTIKGERARQMGEPPSRRRANVPPSEQDVLCELTFAIRDLAAAIRAIPPAAEPQDQYSAAIHDVLSQLDGRLHNNGR